MVRKLLLATMLLTITGTVAFATPIGLGDYTGFRSSADGGGIVGAAAWDDGGLELAWSIEFVDGIYQYTYVLTGENGGVLSKDLSHWLLQVSDSFTADEILFANGNAVDPTTYSPGSQGQSNPEIPGSIYAVKFDQGSSGGFVYVLHTPRSPMWGDFYAKNGVDGGVDVVAWNAGFGIAPSAGGAGLSDFMAWIAVPNTLGPPSDDPTPIPEPGTMVLLGLGLAGLWRLNLRNRVRKGRLQ